LLISQKYAKVRKIIHICKFSTEKIVFAVQIEIFGRKKRICALQKEIFSIENLQI